MKKRIVIAAAFATCLALCAAVWPQKQPAGETPALPTPAAVIATQPEVPEIAEMEEVIPPEEEKGEATLQELVEEADIAPEPSPAQTPPASEVPVPPEQNTTPQQEPEPAPAPDSEPDNQSHLNRMPSPHKNQNPPRLYLAALRTTWSMCRVSAG